jgi:peptidoglycan-associated lipoprotein
MGRDTKMNSENVLQRILIGSVIVVALFGFFGCAKKDQVPPGPEAVEVLAGEEPVGGPGGPVTGEMEPGLAEESLRAEAREELQGRLQDIYFDFDKYNIRPESRLILKENYAVLQGVPGVEVLIEGHCDERGTVEYNLALGQRRANSTRDFLISLGMDSPQLSTVSYGEERPLDPRHNEEAWAKNRRCHFVILK